VLVFKGKYVMAEDEAQMGASRGFGCNSVRYMAQNRVQIQTNLNDKKSLFYTDANAPQKDKKMFRLIPFAILAQKWYRIHIVGNDYQFNHRKFKGAAGLFAVLVTVVDKINPDDKCFGCEAVGKMGFTSQVCLKSGPNKLESKTLIVNADNDESLILGEEEWPDWATDQKTMGAGQVMQSEMHRVSSWISWLEEQRIAKSAPHDAMSALYSTYLEGLDMDEDIMEMEADVLNEGIMDEEIMETLDSMEADVLSEGIKKEDEMKVYNSSVIDQLLWNGSESTEADYAWTADALLYYCWKGVVPMMLFLQQPFRQIILLDLIDAADSVVWPLRVDDTVFELTSARVDNLNDGVGHTTRCRLCILQEKEADEVLRLVQQEAIYSAAQNQIADEEKLAASQL
jgi:hypothetical protein